MFRSACGKRTRSWPHRSFQRLFTQKLNHCVDFRVDRLDPGDVRLDDLLGRTGGSTREYADIVLLEKGSCPAPDSAGDHHVSSLLSQPRRQDARPMFRWVRERDRLDGLRLWIHVHKGKGLTVAKMHAHLALCRGKSNPHVQFLLCVSRRKPDGPRPPGPRLPPPR